MWTIVYMSTIAYIDDLKFCLLKYQRKKTYQIYHQGGWVGVAVRVADEGEGTMRRGDHGWVGGRSMSGLGLQIMGGLALTCEYGLRFRGGGGHG